MPYDIPDDLSIPDWLKRPKGEGPPAPLRHAQRGNTGSGVAGLQHVDATPSNHWKRNLTERDLEVIAEITKGATGAAKIKTDNRIKKMLTNKADKEAVKTGKRWDQQKGKWV